MMEKEKIINAFNNAWNKKFASENSYGKLASKEMFENKQEIIIDGVNVAGCKYYDDETCCNNDVFTLSCEKTNCMYKQLKRLEQENKDFEILAKSLYKRIEELEKENEALAFRERLYKADYEASEQENKELKEFCIELEKQKEKQHNQWFERCTENHNEDSKIIESYRSALEEIKEVEKLAYYSKGMPEEPLSQRDFILDAINNYEQRRIKILTKINEVLQ